MSAPGISHERRVALLADLATLAGYVAEAHIGQDMNPDVCRISPSTGHLLVADAKSKEDPSCLATLNRLVRYIRAAHRAVAGEPFRLAVAHDRADDPAAWLATLSRACRRAGVGADAGTAVAVDDNTGVVWVVVHERS